MISTSPLQTFLASKNTLPNRGFILNFLFFEDSSAQNNMQTLVRNLLVDSEILWLQTYVRTYIHTYERWCFSYLSLSFGEEERY